MMAALVASELRSLVRDRSTVVLAGALLFILLVASIIAAHADLRVYLFFAYVLVPLFTTASAAVLVSGDRQTGYAAVLHTAPVTPAAYYAAKVVAALLFALLAVALTTPLLLLLAAHGGPGTLDAVLPYLGTGALLAAFGAALGLFLSCAVGRRGTMASAFAGLTVAFGLALAPVFLLFLPEALLDVAQRLARVSPVIALYEGGPPQPRDWASEAGRQGLALVAYFTAVLGAAGFAVYTRLQNPDGWDAPRGAALVAGVVALAFMAAPLVALAPPGGGPTPDEFWRAEPSGPLRDVPVEIWPAGAQGREVVLRPGVPTVVAFHLYPQPVGEPLTLTDATLAFAASPDAGLVRFDPPSFALGTLRAEPCRPPETPDCGALPGFDGVLTVTLERTFRLAGGHLTIRASLASAEGLALNHRDAAFEPTGYAVWHSFAVAAGTMAAVATPHALRATTLRRRPGSSAAPGTPPPDAAAGGSGRPATRLR